MEIRQLKSFIAICRARTITGAASQLNIAQPALTRQVMALEEELGVQLLHRHGRGVIPTEAGVLLAQRAEHLIGELEQMIEEVAGRDGSIHGTVTLGLPPALSETLAAPLVEHFMAEHPNALLRLTSGFTGHVRDWLQRGTIDLGITYEFGPVRSPRAMPLLREQLYLVSRRDGAPDSTPIPFVQAFGNPLVLPSPIHGLRQLIDLAAAVQGVSPNVVLEIDIVSGILDFVERGIGNTILSHSTVSARMQAGRLNVRPIVEPELGRTLVLWFSEARQGNRLSRKVADIVVATVDHMVAEGHWSGAVLQSVNRDRR